MADIIIRDLVTEETDEYPATRRVRFKVVPPLRLHENEGWIEVNLTADGRGLVIQGAHELEIAPRVSNSIYVSLRDDQEVL